MTFSEAFHYCESAVQTPDQIQYFLGIIRDEKNPYDWINAYTKKSIKFESWSNTIEITKLAACMTSNGDWHTDDNCVPFCIEPLPEVLSLVFMKFFTRANSQLSPDKIIKDDSYEAYIMKLISLNPKKCYC